MISPAHGRCVKLSRTSNFASRLLAASLPSTASPMKINSALMRCSRRGVLQVHANRSGAVSTDSSIKLRLAIPNLMETVDTEVRLKFHDVTQSLTLLSGVRDGVHIEQEPAADVLCAVVRLWPLFATARAYSPDAAVTGLSKSRV